MLLLNPMQSLTVLTFCAQWMGLAALHFLETSDWTKELIHNKLLKSLKLFYLKFHAWDSRVLKF